MIANVQAAVYGPHAAPNLENLANWPAKLPPRGDCHVKPDLVLIYRLVDDEVLELHQLDSHSEIFG